MPKTLFVPSKETSVDNILTDDVQAQINIQNNVLKWTKELCDTLQKDYDNKSTARNYTFEITTGRKYHKIVEKRGGVHAFINRKTGEVYKPAGYNKPAPHVRYDLRLINHRDYLSVHADWAGSYLYLRG